MIQKILKIRFAALVLLLFVLGPAAARAADDVVLRAMQDEMQRSKTQLHAGDMQKPYYLFYRVDDSSLTTISATLGALATDTFERGRVLTLQVRTGDYTLDNTNFLSARSFGNTAATRSLPLDDDYDQLRHALWLATDETYKQSSRDFVAKRALVESRKNGANLPDFTPQPPVSVLEPARVTGADRRAAQALARELSTIFRGHPEIYESSVDIISRDLYTRFLNSEGTVFTRSEPLIAVRVHASAWATDGSPVHDAFSVFGRTLDEVRSANLPVRVREFVASLLALRSAPVLQRYNGPVLFEGPAAGQLLSDVFAPAIAAARFPVTDEPRMEAALTQIFGQLGGTPLTDKLGGRVMPDFLDVVDRPQLETFAGVSLLGSRKIDDEGVPARELNIVTAGILKLLLATRTPTAEAHASTGSKGLFGAVPSTLVLSSRKTVPEAELRQQLLSRARERGLDYGIVIRGATPGALSWTARFAGAAGLPQGLSDGSVAIYKLYPDGHEERVRDIELSALTAGAFRDIVAVGDHPTHYQGPHVPAVMATLSTLSGGNSGGDLFALGSFISPSVLLDEITLKQVTLPVPNPPTAPSPLASAASPGTPPAK
jgi:hypothetical protein